MRSKSHLKSYYNTEYKLKSLEDITQFRMKCLIGNDDVIDELIKELNKSIKPHSYDKSGFLKWQTASWQ